MVDVVDKVNLHQENKCMLKASSIENPLNCTFFEETLHQKLPHPIRLLNLHFKWKSGLASLVVF